MSSERIAAFCREHGVRRLAVFGSALRDDRRPDSDIDVLVEFESDRTPGLLGIARLERELSPAFGGRRVDLRTPEDLSRYFRQSVIKGAEVRSGWRQLSGFCADWPAVMRRMWRECAAFLQGAQALTAGRGGVQTPEGAQVTAVYLQPGSESVLDQLRGLWPGGGPIGTARVTSPFFDEPGSSNGPALRLWNMLRKRGEASVTWYVTGEKLEDGESVRLNAPVEALAAAEPHGRPGVSTTYMLVKEQGLQRDGGSDAFRPLHLETIILSDEDHALVMMGSSNFTTAGLGIGEHARNIEANLAYLVSQRRHQSEWRALEGILPEAEEVPREEVSGATAPDPDSANASDAPGLPVTWGEAAARVWWPVAVATAQTLPPPHELREVITSARPVHAVLGRWLARRKAGSGDGGAAPIVDPHKKVDTSGFILQRTRRVSWALGALRRRLERPCATHEQLAWRLSGPVAVDSLAAAIEHEAQSAEERVFLLAELGLELSRVRPADVPGGLGAREVREAIGGAIARLAARAAAADASLAQYARTALKEAGA